MKNLKSILAVLLLTALPTLSAASENQQSEALMKQLRINLCNSAAEKSSDIAAATLNAKKHDAMPEIMRQTIEGSHEQEIMKQLFDSKGLISSVLLGSAARGANTMPPSEFKVAVQRIEELTYLFVRDSCISSSLNQ